MAIKHEIRDNEIFVFGSNKAGKHGLGTALTARMKYGAEMGQGFGLQGQSLAIPVKDEQWKKSKPMSICLSILPKPISTNVFSLHPSVRLWANIMRRILHRCSKACQTIAACRRNGRKSSKLNERL